MNEIYSKIIGGYFEIVAGTKDQEFLKAEILEIRYCPRIRKPGVFSLTNGKRIFPGPANPRYSQRADYLKRCVDWSRDWVTGSKNRLVLIRKAYLGGYTLGSLTGD